MPRDFATEAAAQNAAREALYDFRNAARRAVAGLHDARHELMRLYQIGWPNEFNYADLAVGLYTSGVAVKGAPEYTALMRSSRRRANYWKEAVGRSKGAWYTKLLADRAKARTARFASTAAAAEKLANLRGAGLAASEMRVLPGAGAVPVLKRVPIAGSILSGIATYDAIKKGGEPVTEVSATVGSLVVGTVATQVAVAGLVTLGMAGAAPVLIGAAVGAAVAWGVGEGIKWLAHTRVGQDAIADVKEFGRDVGESVGKARSAVAESLGRLGTGLRSVFG
jgi:hypothetical protein